MQPVETHERVEFSRPPAELWPLLTATSAYRRWWPWLRAFDGRQFAAGERWACTVQPPLPYRVRLQIELVEVDPARWVSARVHGDVEGRATLALAPKGSGTMLALDAELAGASRLLRTLSTVAAPLARFGHDWVIRSGLRQFESRL